MYYAPMQLWQQVIVEQRERENLGFRVCIGLQTMLCDSQQACSAVTELEESLTREGHVEDTQVVSWFLT